MINRRSSHYFLLQKIYLKLRKETFEQGLIDEIHAYSR